MIGHVRILVVDDDRAVREGLDRVLRGDGFEVVLAGDGESARSALAGCPPDALVLDLLLPDSDGAGLRALATPRCSFGRWGTRRRIRPRR